MLQDIFQIYQEKNKDFFEKLFNQRIIVFEKITGSFFALEINNSNNLIFYKKSKKIDKLDKLQNKFYLKAINHFLFIKSKLINNLPKNTKFCFEYFPSNQFGLTTYNKLPKNNLILTHYIQNDKIFNDSDKLQKYSQILETDYLPVIFSGELTDEQKNKILDFFYAFSQTYQNQIKSFQYLTDNDLQKNLISNFIKILNPNAKPILQNDFFNSYIEGLIIGFENPITKKYTYMKLLDPIFQQLHCFKKKEMETQNISYNEFVAILNTEILEFLTRDIDRLLLKFRFKTQDYESIYIELICYLFNEFFKEREGKYKDLLQAVELPDFIKFDEYKLNLSLINDFTTLEILNQDFINQEIFKIFLNFLTPSKKKILFHNINLLSYRKMILNKILNYFENIEKILKQKNENQKLTENNQIFSTFYDFLKSQGEIEFLEENTEEDEKEIDDTENKDEKEQDTEIETDSDNKDIQSEDSSIPNKSDLMLKHYFSNDSNKNQNNLFSLFNLFSHFHLDYDKYIEILKSEKIKDSGKSKGIPKINLFISLFQPFHIGHYNTIQNLHKLTNLKTILLQINPLIEENINKVTEPIILKNQTVFISQFDSHKIFERLKQNYSNLIEDFYIYNDNVTIFEILIDILSKYEIRYIVCHKNLKKNYLDEIRYYNQLYPNLKILQKVKEAEFIELSFTSKELSYINSEAVQASIRENNFTKFKSLVLPELYSYFDKFRQILN